MIPTPDPVADLPTSSASTAGATASTKAGASAADLARGYTDANVPNDPYADFPPSLPRGGVVGRPHGWER